MRSKIISFELTMPNVGSWNGRWTSDVKKFYVVRTFPQIEIDKLMDGATSNPIYEDSFSGRKIIGQSTLRKSFYYDFEDGWGASVTMELIDTKEGNRRKKISSGFSGYYWMIDEIIKYGRILKRSERISK